MSASAGQFLGNENNHGYETPKQALETNSRAHCWVLHPPLCGIVRLQFRCASLSELESHNKKCAYTNLQSKVYRGGSETQITVTQ